VIAQCEDLIGKPYLLGARGPDAYDCWGLCIEVYRRGGRPLPEFISADLSRSEIVRLMAAQAPKIAAHRIKAPKDWAFACDVRRGHVGIVFDRRVLHSSRGFGVVAQRLEDFLMLYPNTELLCQH
jgi:cell wall-associated NlpC family hydrolase